jgi:hypothetical protein
MMMATSGLRMATGVTTMAMTTTGGPKMVMMVTSAMMMATGATMMATGATMMVSGSTTMVTGATMATMRALV